MACIMAIGSPTLTSPPSAISLRSARLESTAPTLLGDVGAVDSNENRLNDLCVGVQNSASIELVVQRAGVA